ncbi:MAG: dipicolinate synthase subunit DpsA [Lachnospiraceae bacterium]
MPPTKGGGMEIAMNKSYEFAVEFAVIGGDLRQYYLARQLANHSVITYAIPTPPQMPPMPEASSLQKAVTQAHYILAPIPLTKNKTHLQANISSNELRLSNLVRYLHDGQHFYAGCIPEEFIQKCMEKNVFTKDFMKNEEIALFNSIATAEGTLAEMILHSPDNLQGSSVLITGFGRCARTLSRKLKVLDCQVTICARKPSDRFEAQTAGYAALSFESLPTKISHFSLIINTVPAPIFTDDLLANCVAGTQFIDIASLPGGISGSAEKFPIHVHHALSLPGKYSPKASGEKLAQLILRERKEPICL